MVKYKYIQVGEAMCIRHGMGWHKASEMGCSKDRLGAKKRRTIDFVQVYAIIYLLSREVGAS
jgi:capsule polysaccharide export protein KpsC/LpsZ